MLTRLFNLGLGLERARCDPHWDRILVPLGLHAGKVSDELPTPVCICFLHAMKGKDNNGKALTTLLRHRTVGLLQEKRSKYPNAYGKNNNHLGERGKKDPKGKI